MKKQLKDEVVKELKTMSIKQVVKGGGDDEKDRPAQLAI